MTCEIEQVFFLPILKLRKQGLADYLVVDII